MGANRAPPEVVVPSWCQVPKRAPRIRVDFSDDMSLDLMESAGSEARAILRAAGPGLCVLAGQQADPGLRAALFGDPLRMTVVAFKGPALRVADVRVEAPDPGTAELPPAARSGWLVRLEREDADRAPWRAMHVASAP